MQADTYLPETSSSDEEYSSDSSGDLPTTNNIGTFYRQSNQLSDERFLDQSLKSDYRNIRSNLFFKTNYDWSNIYSI